MWPQEERSAVTSGAYVDLITNRCHLIGTQDPDRVVAVCGEEQLIVNIERGRDLAHTEATPVCRRCESESVPEETESFYRIPLEEFQIACENYDGFCMHCQQITNCGVEPDARAYECESCGERAVYGMEVALLMGAIQVV